MLLPLLSAACHGAAPKRNVEPRAGIEENGKKKIGNDAQKLAAKRSTAFRKGDLDAARKDFQKVLELAPDNVATMINLGLICASATEFAEAETILTRQCGLRPRPAPRGSSSVWCGTTQRNSMRRSPRSRRPSGSSRKMRAPITISVRPSAAKDGIPGRRKRRARRSSSTPNMPMPISILRFFTLQRSPPAIELARRHYHKAVEFGAARDSEVEKKFRRTSRPIRSA